MVRAGREWLAGAVLVFVGLLLLAERRMPELVPVIPLVVGLLVLLLFLLRRSPAALLVGCVLAGAGIGVLVDREGTQQEGVAFLACVAGGFTLAWLAGLLLRLAGVRLWPLVGAVVCGGLAAAVAVSGMGPELRRVALGGWPVAVVGLGVRLRAGARAGRRGHGPDEDTRMVPAMEPPPAER